MQLELELSESPAAAPMLWERLDPAVRQAVIDRLIDSVQAIRGGAAEVCAEQSAGVTSPSPLVSARQGRGELWKRAVMAVTGLCVRSTPAPKISHGPATEMEPRLNREGGDSRVANAVQDCPS